MSNRALQQQLAATGGAAKPSRACVADLARDGGAPMNLTKKRSMAEFGQDNREHNPKRPKGTVKVATQKDTHTHTHRQTHRHTDTDTHTDTHTHAHTHTHKFNLSLLSPIYQYQLTFLSLYSPSRICGFCENVPVASRETEGAA